MVGRRRRRWKRVIQLALAVFLVVAVVLVVMVQHKPAWHRPAELDESGAARARADAANIADFIGDGLVAGRPFEVHFSAKTLNEWLVTSLHDRPEVRDALPPWVRAPAVQFGENEIRLSCLYDTGRWRAILTVVAAGGLSPASDSLEVSFRQALIGSLPIPGWLLEWAATEPLINALRDRYSLDGDGRSGSSRGVDVLHRGKVPVGVRVRNAFVWPNGRRTFRIGDVRFSDGQVTLRIEPLR